MSWEPAVYGRFAPERDRPFYDLLARVDGAPRRIVDLGCGDGHLTRVLAERWPQADVVGIDSSSEMLRGASARANVRFAQGDITEWSPDAPVDLIVANAALHWVPDHPALLRRLIGHLTDRGVLAVQMPSNFHASSHRLVRETASRPPWADHLDGLGAVHVLAPEGYLRVLVDLGMHVDLWMTTYHHLLDGPDPVLRWLEGTTLRPYLARLPPDQKEPFLRVLGGALDAAYPAESGRVLFPFTRLFFVATRDQPSTSSKPAEA